MFLCHRVWIDYAKWKILATIFYNCSCIYSLFSRYIIFDLITAHTPISALSSNSIVFRLPPVYGLSTSLQRHMLWVPVWIASACQVDAIQMSTHNVSYVVGTYLNCIDLSSRCNSNEYPQHTLLSRKSGKNTQKYRISIIWWICLIYFFKCILRIGRYIFYHKFSKYFWKT